METTTTNANADHALFARGYGREAYRRGRLLQQAVSEAVRAYPELAAHVAGLREGWRSARSEAVADARATL